MIEMPRQAITTRALAEALCDIKALKFGDFTLASGKKSTYYLDLRVVPTHPEVFSLVLAGYAKMVEGLGEDSFDVLAGIATAGVAMSSPLAVILKKPMVYIRSQEKGYGRRRLVEGDVRAGWRAVVVDDLITTGGSITSAVKALREEGCRVAEAVVLVDRMEGGGKNLAEMGVKLNALVTIGQLVEDLRKSGKITKKEHDAVVGQIRSGKTSAAGGPRL
jgi:orotate phosphoribosyltransferase